MICRLHAAFTEEVSEGDGSLEESNGASAILVIGCRVKILIGLEECLFVRVTLHAVHDQCS